MLTRSAAGARHQAIRRILLVVFVVFAAATVLFPQALTELAKFVGVGRGADLLLYALVIAFLGYVSTSYRRMSRMEDRIARLSRQVALSTVRQPGVTTPPATPAPSDDASENQEEPRG
ncbi:MAG: DUF2304 domain-containing protein [Actinobacteria bacterium]|nr:DUF2304 domain-containing protein [Actinomycetota bacterium]